jgi:hypothetical protein
MIVRGDGTDKVAFGLVYDHLEDIGHVLALGGEPRK